MLDPNESGTVKTEGDSYSYGFKEFDVGAQIKEAAGNLLGLPAQMLSVFKQSFSISNAFNAAADLDKKSADIVKVLGVGFQRSAEIQRELSQAIPEFLSMGLKAEDASTTYESLIKKFNINLKLSDEQLVSLAATAKVTGIGVDELAKSFMDVGVSLAGVEKNMLVVTEVANKAGVTVAAVSGGVTKNLDKMNLYNFEGGIKGLAKMSAQASRLGIDMGQIFSVVEDVFNPEGAIELAASLQRLGVQTSELLDPLRLMDLAQNDPTELQNQIVDMTKQFTRFNEETQQFEILPGAKRQMAEVGKALGMTGGEFQKMALNAANFDAKLKQIKFSPEVKEEDRELVATLAQINEKGVAEVKVKTVDSTGKFTGEEAMVEVSKLTTEQIKSLTAEQAIKGKSMQEIAIEQLSEMARTNAILNERLGAYAYGMAETPLIKTPYKGLLGGVRSGAEYLPEKSDDYIKGVDAATGEMSKALKDLLDTFGIDTQTLIDNLGGFVDSATETLKNTYDGIKEITKDIYDYFTTSEATASPNLNSSPTASLNAGINNTNNAGAATAQATPTEITINHTFNFDNLPANVTTAQVQTMLKEYTTNPKNAYESLLAAAKVNSNVI